MLRVPTSKGEPRNPYVGARHEGRLYAKSGWSADAWGSGIVLLRYHRWEVFARYVVALLRGDPETKSSFADFPRLSIRHDRMYGDAPRRRVHKVSTSKLHLRRMQVELLGRLPLDAEAVAREFAPDRPPLARYGEREFANDARTSGPLFASEPVEDPIARFLV